MTTNQTDTPEQAKVLNSTSSIFNHYTHKLITLFQGRKMSAIWITVIVIFCSAWTIWNISHFESSLEFRNKLLREKLSLNNQIEKLTKQIDIAKVRYNEKQKTYAESRVFDDYTSIAEWLYQITREAKEIGFDIEYNMSQPITHEELNEINKVPIDIAIVARNKKNIELVYQQYLVFLQRFFEQDFYISVSGTELKNISGDSAKLSLDIIVYIWNKDDSITNFLSKAHS